MRRALVVAYVHQFHHDLYVRWQANPSVYRAISDWCRHERREDVLSGLVLPGDPRRGGRNTAADALEQTPAEDAGASEDADLGLSTFPDPTDARVFWIASVVRDLPDEVDLDAFAPYLETRT